MAHWLARPEDQVRRDWMKRFDPRYWLVNFPRPMMAAVTTTGSQALRVDAVFYKADEIAGLIWESEDRHDHPLLAYATGRDYRHVRLSFRWRSGGIMPLNAVNGPTLTIEGRDAEGRPRAWYVRLWNYAQGTPEDAAIELDFGQLSGGFLLPTEADPLWAGDIDRMFISLAPRGYDGSARVLAEPAEGWAELSGIVAEGSGSVIAVGDAFLPEHRLRAASGYDDSYHVTPERLLRNAEAMGYRRWLNHYIGMSHQFRLRWDAAARRFLAVEGAQPFNTPFLAWHRALLRGAREHGFEVILSLSYELFDAHAPEAWKQRAHDGAAARTGYEPPSTLLSPASAGAQAYLEGCAGALARLAVESGQPVHVQVGEPWWWVGPDGAPCIYDTHALASYAADTGKAPGARVAGPVDALNPQQAAYFEWCGEELAASTLRLRDAVRAVAADARTYLLFFTPQVLNAQAHALARLNLPAGWAHPAFDVLQVEDYDFVTAGEDSSRRQALATVQERLGYPAETQQYLAGFVTKPGDVDQWNLVMKAASDAEAKYTEVFLWALPQVLRDGLVHSDSAEVPVSFDDVLFPLALGLEATAEQMFFTQLVTTTSGHERRNSHWAEPRRRFDIGPGLRSRDDLYTLMSFHRERMGRARAFRFRDPVDHSSSGFTQSPTAFDQVIGEGDGVQTRFPLRKTYGNGRPRAITLPVASWLHVAANFEEIYEGWHLAAGGVIEFDAAPAAGVTISAGFLFDVPVRFEDDALSVSLAMSTAGELPSIYLIETREG